MTTQKKYSLIAFAICLVLTITLLGCKKGMDISKDDALEVALDYSGFSQEEIQNPTVTEQEDGNNGFLVTFGTPSGDFECVISPKGIMQAQYYADARYGKSESDENNRTDETDGENQNNKKAVTDEVNDSQSSLEANNGSESNSKLADKDNPKNEADNEKDSQSPATSESNKRDAENKSGNDHNNQPNRTPEEETALNLALQNVGAEEDDVENVSIHPAGPNIEVRFKYGESTNIVTVNTATNSVVSTIFE